MELIAFAWIPFQRIKLSGTATAVYPRLRAIFIPTTRKTLCQGKFGITRSKVGDSIVLLHSLEIRKEQRTTYISLQRLDRYIRRIRNARAVRIATTTWFWLHISARSNATALSQLLERPYCHLQRSKRSLRQQEFVRQRICTSPETRFYSARTGEILCHFIRCHLSLLLILIWLFILFETNNLLSYLLSRRYIFNHLFLPIFILPHKHPFPMEI